MRSGWMPRPFLGPRLGIGPEAARALIGRGSGDGGGVFRAVRGGSGGRLGAAASSPRAPGRRRRREVTRGARGERSPAPAVALKGELVRDETGLACAGKVVVIPQRNGGKAATASGKKVEIKMPLAPMFAEKLKSPRRKGAT